MTDRTPSPQSVVVPVEALKDAERQAVNEQAWATGHLLESIIAHAAPAPSSLAGGEVRARLENDLRTRNLYREEDGQTRLKVREDDLRAILAALSPEAPAREGVQWGWRVRAKPNKFTHDRPWHWQADEQTGITAENCEYEPVYTSAPTPRHEAPASPTERELDLLDAVMRAGGIVKTAAALPDKAAHLSLLTDALNRADAILTEGLNGAPVSHEAPAEGAGEVTPAMIDAAVESVPDLADLLELRRPQRFAVRVKGDGIRARSSAPEAREGEVVGVVYSLKADLNTAELPDGTLLYTHPAHPSADHAELTRLAEAAKTVRRDANGRLDGDDAVRMWVAFHDAMSPGVCSALLSEIAALRGERDGLRNRVSCLERLGGEQSTRVMEQATRANDAERQRDELRKALEAARDVLHKHYVDFDGEPEDAVALGRAWAETERALANQGADHA